MRSYIGRKRVDCLPAAAGAYQCRLGKFDLSEVVLVNGGGRVRADAPARLKQAEQTARRNKAGIWAR